MGTVDFGGNFCLLKSFEYTSALSVVLITSATPIFVMFISMVFLQRVYGRIHGIGAIIVVSGIGLINYSKYLDQKDHSFEWKGALLALCASLGYAMSGVIQEFIVQVEEGYPFGTLHAMGLVGSLVSGFIANATPVGQADRDSIVLSSDPRALYAIGFVVSLSLFHLFIPIYIKRYGCVIYNISLITSDIWVYLYNLIYQPSTQLGPVYMCGFACILVGLVVFNVAGLFGLVDNRVSLAPKPIDSEDDEDQVDTTTFGHECHV